MVHRIETSARSIAGPDRVFALLADGATWPVWGAWERYELAVPDPAGGQGVGAERIFFSHTAGRETASRERVTAVDPGRRIEYALVSGLPLVDYTGIVTLTPDAGGTLISWRSSFDRATPGMGWFYRAVLQRFIADAARRLAAHADGPASPG